MAMKEHSWNGDAVRVADRNTVEDREAVNAVGPLEHARAEVDALAVASCLFHGFSDPARLAIVQHLALGEHRVVDLTAHLGLAQSTVSKHLACLRDCGLTSSRPQGRASLWSLNHPEAVMELLASAEKLLGLTGDAVALCPNYGITTLEETR